jgi:hypothetical protein
VNYLPRLALNDDPPDLCLLSSWDYRRELLAPGTKCVLAHLRAQTYFAIILNEISMKIHQNK